MPTSEGLVSVVPSLGRPSLSAFLSANARVLRFLFDASNTFRKGDRSCSRRTACRSSLNNRGLNVSSRLLRQFPHARPETMHALARGLDRANAGFVLVRAGDIHAFAML
jgi:hypothetical protein